MNRVVKETNAQGLLIVSDYNDLDLAKEISQRDAKTDSLIAGFTPSKYGYDITGKLITLVDQYSDEVTFAYDKLGRKTEERQKDYSFEAIPNGQNTFGDKVTTYRYDNFGNADLMTGLKALSTSYGDFDSLGRAKKITETDTVTSGQSSPQRSTEYEFDPAGNITKLTDPEGNITRYWYDGLNRLVKEEIDLPADQGGTVSRAWEFDSAGNLIKLTDRNKRVTEYRYDTWNHRVEETAKDATAAQNVTYRATFTYDEVGRLLSAGDANSDYVYSNYDERGRAKTVEQTIRIPGDTGVKTTFTYEYFDEVNFQTAAATARTGYSVTAVVADPVGTGSKEYYKNTYLFDAAGREVFASQDVSGEASDKQVLHRFNTTGSGTWTPASGDPTPYAERYDEVVFTQLPADSGRSDVVVTKRIFYEKYDPQLIRRIDITTPGNVGGSDTSYLYNYDQRDLLRQFDEPNGGLQKLDYDGFGQSIVASGYTANGNPISKASPAKTKVPYNRSSIIDTTGGRFGEQKVTYDAEGNVLNTSPLVTSYRFGPLSPPRYPSTWLVADYSWDSRNRLTSSRERSLNNGAVQDRTVKYYYDVFNNLIGKQVESDALNGQQVGVGELYVQNGGQTTLTFEFKKNATPPHLTDRSFHSTDGEVYAIDAHPIVNDIPEPLSTHWLVVDRQGNVRESYRFGFDANGVTQSWVHVRFDYTDWGAPKAVAQPDGNHKLYGVKAEVLQRFQGAKYDKDLRSFKFGDRWLSTSLRRWVSEDPSGLRYGSNPYVALGNSPLNYRDPTGNLPIIPALLWGAAAFAAGGAVIGAVSYYGTTAAFGIKRTGEGWAGAIIGGAVGGVLTYAAGPLNFTPQAQGLIGFTVGYTDQLIVESFDDEAGINYGRLYGTALASGYFGYGLSWVGGRYGATLATQANRASTQVSRQLHRAGNVLDRFAPILNPRNYRVNNARVSFGTAGGGHNLKYVAPASNALRPSNFGVATIAEDAGQLRMWNDAMRSAASSSRSNGYTRYLEALDRGQAPTQQMLEEAFSAVNSRYLKSARASGLDVAEVHHWNFSKTDFPTQIVDPRHLVPVPTRTLHETIHRATTGTVDIWAGPIDPLHQIRILEWSTPLAPR